MSTFYELVDREPTRSIGIAGTASVGTRGRVALVRNFYAQPGRRLELAVTSLILTYGGGAVMFWLHAIYRGEQGPPISNAAHWLLDSTLGCIALTPVILVLLPVVDAWARAHLAGASSVGRAGVLGAAFAMVTGPGPILHNIVAGQGTPLARLATDVFGEDPHIAAHGPHVVEHSAASEVLLQLSVGLPVYIALAALSLSFVKIVRRHQFDRGDTRALHRPTEERAALDAA